MSSTFRPTAGRDRIRVPRNRSPEPGETFRVDSYLQGRYSHRPQVSTKHTPLVALAVRLLGGQAAAQQLQRPDPVPGFDPVPVLRTIPIGHDKPLFNVQMVDAALSLAIARASGFSISPSSQWPAW